MSDTNDNGNYTLDDLLLDEEEIVAEQDYHYVWTKVQAEMCLLIVPGMTILNRLGFYVFDLPWENMNEVVVVSMDIECRCYDETNGEGDPNCAYCRGLGLRTVHPEDTAVRLHLEKEAD